MKNDTTSTQNTIIYELPLNEAIRVSLRLEQLFETFDQTASAKTSLDTAQAMTSLLRILDVVDRPDIKSKLSQTLTLYTNSLSQLKQSPQVDSTRLEKELSQLATLNHKLHTNYQRLDEALRQNEFLSQIRAHLASPGGISKDRSPSYLLWQQQTPEMKSQELHRWMHTFDDLRHIVTTIMTLTRNSAPFKEAIAENGFYHHTFNPSQPIQMARIKLSISQNIFPEFGAGKHRLTIRLLSPEYHDKGRPKQTQLNIPFELSCCRL